MLIGELAARAGVGARTIRFYESAGLVPPPPRTRGGYRDYDEDALNRLAFIRRAQSAGFTLGEIRDVIRLREKGTAPCTHVRGVLDDKAAAVQRQIAELRAVKRELDDLRRWAAGIDPNTCNPRRICDVLALSASDE